MSTKPWTSRLFGSYSHDFNGDPPEYFAGTLRQASPFLNRARCGMVDVTRGTNPYDIADYTTMSLDEAMRIYWLSKKISVSGSTSFSGSSSGGGTFEIYTQERVPDSNPAEYEIVLKNSWTHNVSASCGDSKEFSTKNETGPFEPYKRVCPDKFHAQLACTPESRDFNSDFAPSIYQAVDSRADGSTYRISYDEYGYESDYDPQYGFTQGTREPEITTVLPRPPQAFYDNGEFVGWGFTSPFVMIDSSVQVTTSWTRPFIPVRDGNAYVGSRGVLNLVAGGQMYLGNVSYINEDIGRQRMNQYDFTDSHESTTVEYMGVDMLFTTQATGGSGSFDPRNKVTITTGNGITISYSDSDSKGVDGNADARGSSGAGSVFTGSGQLEASASFTINISEPEFYDYPESASN